MLFALLKTPYNLVQIEDFFFQLCGWGYCGMRAYLEALRVYSQNDFNIWIATCTVSVSCVTYADSSGLYKNGKEG